MQHSGRGAAIARAAPWLAGLVLTLSGLVPILAAVLPEDRFDALYHAYRGGGVEVDGPSLLARMHLGKNASLSANYYVDSITSASIDVVTSASPYSERRVEKSLSGDLLVEDAILSLGYTASKENDFDSRTASFSVSQSMFGDLTTVSLGYQRGWDVVGKRGDPAFSEQADRRRYRFGLSQILSKRLILALNLETASDEGFLNNPYRSVRFIDPGSARGYGFEPEVYPRTHTSTALGLHARYALPYPAALSGEYRYYTDSWGIDAWNVALGYSLNYERRWLLDLRWRIYRQGAADFYSDLFPYRGAQNFLARDKELSHFTNQSFGLGLSYGLDTRDWRLIDRGRISLSWDHITFDYRNFRDLGAGGSVGQEPLYGFSADVLQLYLSLWY